GDHCPTALSSARGDGVPGRSGPAGSGRCHGAYAGYLLRSGRELRDGTWPLRRVGGGRRAGAAAGTPGGRSRDGVPGRWDVLPKPGSGPGRGARGALGRVAPPSLDVMFPDTGLSRPTGAGPPGCEVDTYSALKTSVLPGPLARPTCILDRPEFLL